jgi:hypothetical protein
LIAILLGIAAVSALGYTDPGWIGPPALKLTTILFSIGGGFVVFHYRLLKKS